MAAAKYTVAMRTGDPTGAGNSGKNLRISVEGSLRTDNLDLL